MLCFGLPVSLIQLQRDSWIAPFQTRFAGPLASVSGGASIDTLAPKTVGGFQRLSIVDYSSPGHLNFLAYYTNPNVTYSDLRLSISEWQVGAMLKDGFPSRAFDNIGGWDYQNLNSKYPFSYQSIPTFSDRGVGISWINGNWLLHISSDRAEILEFFSQYPY
jgi:hypothetical protein